jgi:hypothetical protein
MNGTHRCTTVNTSDRGPTMYRRYFGGTATLFLLILVTACAGSGTGPTGSPPSQPSVGTSRVPTTGTSGTEVTAHDKDNGAVLTLRRGQRIRIVLSSTYWNFQGSSDPVVLRADGQPRISPQPSGCVPGAGCGTATATYLAVATGEATVTATRTSCGEAMGCTGSDALYSLRVVVN